MAKRRQPESDNGHSQEAGQYGIPPSVRNAMARAGESQPLWFAGGVQTEWAEIECEELSPEDVAALEADGVKLRDVPLSVTPTGEHPGASLKRKD